MVEHIDSLTFGPSLNESESPVNNFSSPALSLIYRHRGAFLSLASRRRRKGRVIEKKKRKEKTKSFQTPRLRQFPNLLDSFHLPICGKLEIGSDFIYETRLHTQSKTNCVQMPFFESQLYFLNSNSFFFVQRIFFKTCFMCWSLPW